ncbi:MAG: hypothetical protein HZB47_13855 [Nitrosomonadales bacterium]|nr:hypothetical protein [Nitrosomonadales bacterium]
MDRISRNIGMYHQQHGFFDNGESLGYKRQLHMNFECTLPAAGVFAGGVVTAL